jgi:hypothetical protein
MLTRPGGIALHWMHAGDRVDPRVRKESLSISGYWRDGATDEGWQAGKAEWNCEVEETELAVGLA